MVESHSQACVYEGKTVKCNFGTTFGWTLGLPFPLLNNNLLQKQAQRAAFLAVAAKGSHTDLFQQQQKSHRV